MRISSELKVGIMVAVSLTLLGMLIIAASGKFFLQQGYTIVVYFDYVSGLNTGAPVRLAGMEVGEVKDLVLSDSKIAVTLKLEPTAKIRSDSNVTINSLGIVGEKYVEITLGTPQGKILESGSMIKGITPVNIDEVLGRTEAIVNKSERIIVFMDKILGGEEIWIEFDKILKNTATITTTLNELLDENKEEINHSIKNLHSISLSLKRIVEENRDDFRDTTKKLKESAFHFQQASLQLSKILSDLNLMVGGTKKGIAETLSELTKITDSTQSILKKIEKGDGALGKLVSDKEVANHLTNAAKNIDELTLELKRNPWKLLQKGKEGK
ncbi:MAG: MlaD family protein [bacterium]|nr:MlaD family protein [bacterium]